MKNWQNLRQSDWRTLERFISRKLNQGYDCEQIEEGVLGLGIIHLIGCKHTYIIKERPLNCWSSTHTIEKINN